jgi:hypothetical protein
MLCLQQNFLKTMYFNNFKSEQSLSDHQHLPEHAAFVHKCSVCKSIIYLVIICDYLRGTYLLHLNSVHLALNVSEYYMSNYSYNYSYCICGNFKIIIHICTDCQSSDTKLT